MVQTEPGPGYTPPNALKMGYRPEVDGLRAFAVVAVIINHFNKQLLPSGYLGVDVFFVISGYVITASLASRRSRGIGEFLVGFYDRRLKRLLPALLPFVLVMAGLICWLNPEATLPLRTGTFALFGLSNIYLFKQSTNYFAQSSELNPFTHTWSLGVEEQFYFLFPLIFWLSGFSRGIRQGARNLAVMIGILALASLTGFIYLYSHDQPAAYFLMPARFWELAAGCLVFLAMHGPTDLPSSLKKAPPLLILLAMVAVMYLPITAAIHATISIVLLTCLLIVCLREKTAGYSILTLDWIVSIGLLSYSLYLWHWGVLSISRWTVGIHWWSSPFQLLVMLILALLSYRFLEKPLRKKTFFSARWMTLIFWMVCLQAASAILSFFASESAKGAMYLFKRSDDQMFIGQSSVNGADQINQTSCMGSFSALAEAPDVILKQAIADCSLPPAASGQGRSIYFIGDSQSDQLKALAGLIHQRLGYGVQVASVLDTFYPTVRLQTNRDSNKQLRDARRRLQERVAEDLLSKLKSGDIVVLSGRYSAAFGDPTLPLPLRGLLVKRLSYRDPSQEVSIDDSLNEWLNRLKDFAEKVHAKGATTVLLLPIPEFAYSGPRCSSPFTKINPLADCQSSRQWLLDNRKLFTTSLHKTFKDSSLIHLYDPFPLICPAGPLCSVLDYNGKLIFRDATHLSNYAAFTVYPDFVHFLKRNKII